MHMHMRAELAGVPLSAGAGSTPPYKITKTRIILLKLFQLSTDFFNFWHLKRRKNFPLPILLCADMHHG